MDQKNFAIGVLSTTAAILLVGLAIVASRPAPASAAGMTASGGDYVMTIARTPQPDEEFVYVVNVPAQKMVVYRFDATRGLTDMVQAFDLSMLRLPPDRQPSGRP